MNPTAYPDASRPRMVVAHAGRTDVGRVRSRNEDNLAVAPDLNLFIVADGMGGHRGGDEASRQGCLVLEDYLRRHSAIIRSHDLRPTQLHRREVVRLLQDAIRTANERIIADSELHADREGMATTVVLALLSGDRAFIAHVGDSRAILMRDGQVDLVTEDHSLFFELVRQGRLQKSSTFQYKNVVTRALGIRGSAVPEVTDFEVVPGDRILLCTDGLHGYLDDAAALRLAGKGDLETAVGRLIAFANEAGGSDNITAILVEVLGTAGDADASRRRDQVLASLPIFARLSRGDRLRVVSACECRTLEDGECLFREGDATDGLYAVLSGEVELRRAGERVARFGTGGEFGEMSLLEKQPRLVTGVAVGPTEVLMLSRTTFESLLRRSPTLASQLLSNLVRVLAVRLRNANDELAILRDHLASEGREVPQVLPSDLIEEEAT